MIPPEYRQQLDDLEKNHDTKGQDYSRPDQPYSNIRSAERWRVEAWRYCLVRAGEKFNRLQNFAEGKALNHESAESNLMEIADLCLMARMFLQQEQQREDPAASTS